MNTKEDFMAESEIDFEPAVIADLKKIVDGFLVSEGGGSLPDCHVLNNFDTARLLAYEDVVPAELVKLPVLRNYLHDIKTDMLGFCYESVPYKDSAQSRRREALIFELDDYLNKKLKETPYSEIAEQVLPDIEIMLFTKSFGLESHFGTLIYTIYSAGAWPCGWVGEFPNGKPIIFWPFKNPPQNGLARK
jgi:hypothetical protein